MTNPHPNLFFKENCIMSLLSTHPDCDDLTMTTSPSETWPAPLPPMSLHDLQRRAVTSGVAQEMQMTMPALPPPPPLRDLPDTLSTTPQQKQHLGQRRKCISRERLLAVLDQAILIGEANENTMYPDLSAD